MSKINKVINTFQHNYISFVKQMTCTITEI